MGLIPSQPTWQAGKVVTKAQMDQANAFASFWANPPRVEVRNTSTISYANNTETVVSYNQATMSVVQSGDSPMWSSANASRIYIRTTGRYVINGHIYVDRNKTTGAFRDLKLYRNTTSLGVFHAPIAGGMVIIPNFVAQLTAGDYLEMRFRQDSGAAMTITIDNDRPWNALLAAELVGI